MDSFILYTSYYDIVKDLTDEQLGQLTRAIFTYAQDGTEIELQPVVRMAFSFIRSDMEHNNGKYQARLKARSDAGKKGGAPKGNNNARKKACSEVAEAKIEEVCGEVANALNEVENTVESEQDCQDEETAIETNKTTKNKQNKQKQAKQPKTTKNNQKQAKTSKTSLYEYEECISISSNNLESSNEASLSKDKTFDPPNVTHAVADGKEAQKGGMDYSALKEYWNRKVEETHSTMRRLTIMSDQRKSNVRGRLRDYGGNPKVIFQAIDKAMRSDFMNGHNRKGWTASFDWIMCPTNFPKVLEGNYDKVEVDNDDAPWLDPKAPIKTKTLKNARYDRLETRRGTPAPSLTDDEYKRQNTWAACK